MNVAVIGTSRKDHDKRVAIHPQHIAKISEQTRQSLFFETNYGAPFGVTDQEIASWTGHAPVERKSLMKSFKAIIIPKPVEADFMEMQPGTRVWGWIHSVQQSNITDIAIDKKLDLIAWENMYVQSSRDKIHVFYKNNEMAGYCGVQHALQLRGIDGFYGTTRQAIVISFGSVSRGAIYALKGHGIHNITVLTRRPVSLVADQVPDVLYKQLILTAGGSVEVKDHFGATVPIMDELVQADVIVNGILQNPNEPLIFAGENDIRHFKKECLLIDISCDQGMGFSFAQITNMTHPFIKKGNILYYSVDHTPTLLWDSATWEISNSLLPFLSDFIEQADNAVLEAATDIKKGVIINPDIIAFQNRAIRYPHPIKTVIKNLA